MVVHGYALWHSWMMPLPLVCVTEVDPLNVSSSWTFVLRMGKHLEGMRNLQMHIPTPTHFRTCSKPSSSKLAGHVKRAHMQDQGHSLVLADTYRQRS